MDCQTFVYLFLGFCALGCAASREHDSSEHRRSHVHQSIQHKKKILSPHKHTQEKYHSKLHKKEEMLGQDMMRINDAEFKLQSLVSPEFHQGHNAMRTGKSFGNMEVNTLSPEQVEFVQSTSQWPKFSNPEDRDKDMAKTIYPENPVLFPEEAKKQQSNNENWITVGSNSYKSMGGVPFDDMSMGSMGQAMGSMGQAMGSMGQAMGPIRSMSSMNGMFGQPQMKSNSMDFEVKPGYTTTADAPIDDRMPPFSELRGLKLEGKRMGGFEGSPKHSFSSLLNEGVMNRRGKPIGILGNILKASQEMPTGRVMKPSGRSRVWFNDGPFSRRHDLERSRQTDASKKGSASNEKHTFKARTQ